METKISGDGGGGFDVLIDRALGADVPIPKFRYCDGGKYDCLSIVPTSDHQSLSLLPINSEPLNILLLSHAFVLLAGRFVIRFWGNIYDF